MQEKNCPKFLSGCKSTYRVRVPYSQLSELKPRSLRISWVFIIKLHFKMGSLVLSFANKDWFPSIFSAYVIELFQNTQVLMV